MALKPDGRSERRETMIRWLMERPERIRLRPFLFRCVDRLVSLEMNRFFLPILLGYQLGFLMEILLCRGY